MGMLYEKGLFKYEDKISQYWPKFGENGKSEIKICAKLAEISSKNSKFRAFKASNAKK